MSSGSNINIALQDLSIEIGVHDIDALRERSESIPTGTSIYVNAVAGAGATARIETATALAALGYRPVPHIAARRMVSAEALHEYVDGLVTSAGVDEVLLIGGDIEEPLGPYDCALDVISSGILEQHGIGRIGIAGYPDGHPLISAPRLSDSFERKLAAAASAGLSTYVVSQFSFQATAIIDWVEKLHQRHPTLDIHAGIPGPAKLKTLLRFAKICGVQSSAKKLLANREVGLDLLRGAEPWEQLEAIGRYKSETGRSVTTHIFTFGGLKEVFRMLSRARDGVKDGESVRI